jgi:bacterioferritin
LTNELTAINQYFLQAEMCEHWGYPRLYRELRRLSIDEMKEAEEILEHILYLDGIPNMQRLNQVRVGENVEEHFQLDLDLEKNQDKVLTDAIVHCAQVGDYTTRNLLEEKIREEKDHIDWLETQLDTIKQIGLTPYLTQQIKKGDE